MATPNPFEGTPFFGDIGRIFSAQGPVNWEIARQIAMWMATGGSAEANPDPLVRIRLEELGRVAELHVAEATGLSLSATGRPAALQPVGRGAWAQATLDAYRPLFERLASALGRLTISAAEQAVRDDIAASDEEDAGMSELLGTFGQVLNPLILGLQLGSMVGHLSRRSIGQYDLPIPRPPSDDLLVVSPNLDAFAKDWSLPADDVQLWLSIDLLVHHAVLNRPHVRARLEELLTDYVGSFRSDPSALESRLAGLDINDPSSIQDLFGNPDALFESMESDAQRALKPRLEALTVAIEGYVDHMLDRVGSTLIASYPSLAEALRRRRVDRNEGDKAVERIFGLELSQAQYDRGVRFVDGLYERAGDEGLARLWESERTLPTPAEVDAPGLYWERINLPDLP